MFYEWLTKAISLGLLSFVGEIRVQKRITTFYHLQKGYCSLYQCVRITLYLCLWRGRAANCVCFRFLIITEEGGSDNRKSRERVCFRRLNAYLQWYIHQSDQIWIITGVYSPRRAEKYEKPPIICVFYHCYFVFRYTSRSGRVRKSFRWNKILNSLIFS